MRTIIVALSLLIGVGCGSTTSTTAVTANAGDDWDVLVGATVELDGQASSGVTTAQWSLTSKPSGSSASLSNSTSLTASLVADVAGAYTAQLSINSGASTDSVVLTAKNVVAGITVPSGSALTTRERFNTTEYVINLGQTGGILSAAGSSTSSALKLKDTTISSYAWEQVSGPAATTTNGTTNSTLEFTAPALTNFLNVSDRYKWQILPISRNDTKMVFKLTVTDSSGNTDVETFTVYVENDGSELHTSSGLPNVGLGTTVILSGPNLDSSGASATDTTKENGDAITDWSWTLSAPSGSSTTFLDSSATTSTSQFPRFIPDVAGLYTVSYSSTTGNSTSAVATVKTPGTLTINAADYVGVGTIGGTTPVSPQCGNCHDGSVEADKVTSWAATTHGSIFANSMSTYAGLAPEPYLWSYHTVGYDPDAVNDGFDELASADGFTFPEDGLTFAQFTSGHPSVSKLANVQCENCHGPGSMHDGDPLRISDSFAQFGACGQCHIQEEAWANSGHNSTGVKHGSGAYQAYWVTNAKCVRCHNAKGFDTYLEEGEEGLADMSSDTGAFPGITCAACHNPHSATNAKQLRIAGNVTMIIDNSTVDAGKAAVCYTCHDGNYSFGETDCDTNSDGTSTGNTSCATTSQTANEYWRGGYHYGTQGPVLEGKGALTDLDDDGDDDFTSTENSFHSGSTFTLAGVTGNNNLSSTNDKCITCHMASGPAQTEEGYLHLGGHAFKLRTDHGLGHLQGGEEAEDTTATAGELELVSACTVCHASVTEMNRTARADYDGDGSTEGIQDEITGLLLNLSTKIKALDTANVSQTSGTTSSSGTITVNTISWAGSKSSIPSGKNCTTSLPTDGKDVYQPCNFLDASKTLRRAVWNHNMLIRDGSLGIHNAAYTIQVLQGTYKALGILLEGDATTTTYKTDFPNATLR